MPGATAPIGEQSPVPDETQPPPLPANTDAGSSEGGPIQAPGVDPLDSHVNAVDELFETPPDGEFALEPDPWAHRRGEPRMFAFFWTLYVFLAVAGSVLWLARTGGWILGGYGPAGRIMLMVVAVGATVLWPMTRLSQASPGVGSVRAMLADTIVVLLPIQMVVWPMTWLAGWPLSSTSGIAATMGVWIVLIGGVLAFALGGRAVERARDSGLTARAFWMAGLLVAVLAGPAASTAFRGGHLPDWLPVLSPISGILAMTGTGISGPQQALTIGQWVTISGVGAAGLMWWIAAIAQAAVYPRPEGA